MEATPILFGVFAFLALFFACLVIAFKNPVSSAFSLVMVLFNVAAIFAIQDAHFAAVIQVLVYAGAIAVLFIFVIMLLNIDVVPLDFPRTKARYGLAAALAVSFLGLLTFVFVRGSTSAKIGEYTVEAIEANGGNIRLLSHRMFTNYVFSFEMVAVLLTLAVVGAIVLAKRKVD